MRSVAPLLTTHKSNVLPTESLVAPKDAERGGARPYRLRGGITLKRETSEGCSGWLWVLHEGVNTKKPESASKNGLKVGRGRVVKRTAGISESNDVRAHVRRSGVVPIRFFRDEILAWVHQPPPPSPKSSMSNIFQLDIKPSCRSSDVKKRARGFVLPVIRPDPTLCLSLSLSLS